MTVFELEEGKRFYISPHAQDRILDMQLDPADVRRCLVKPRYKIRSTKYPDSENWHHKRFCLGVKQDGDVHVIATAVWSEDGAWRADLLGRPAYEGREYRKAPLRKAQPPKRRTA